MKPCHRALHALLFFASATLGSKPNDRNVIGNRSLATDEQNPTADVKVDEQNPEQPCSSSSASSHRPAKKQPSSPMHFPEQQPSSSRQQDVDHCEDSPLILSVDGKYNDGWVLVRAEEFGLDRVNFGMNADELESAILSMIGNAASEMKLFIQNPRADLRRLFPSSSIGYIHLSEQAREDFKAKMRKGKIPADILAVNKSRVLSNLYWVLVRIVVIYKPPLATTAKKIDEYIMCIDAATKEADVSKKVSSIIAEVEKQNDNPKIKNTKLVNALVELFVDMFDSAGEVALNRLSSMPFYLMGEMQKLPCSLATWEFYRKCEVNFLSKRCGNMRSKLLMGLHSNRNARVACSAKSYETLKHIEIPFYCSPWELELGYLLEHGEDQFSSIFQGGNASDENARKGFSIRTRRFGASLKMPRNSQGKKQGCEDLGMQINCMVKALKAKEGAVYMQKMTDVFFGLAKTCYLSGEEVLNFIKLFELRQKGLLLNIDKPFGCLKFEHCPKDMLDKIWRSYDLVYDSESKKYIFRALDIPVMPTARTMYKKLAKGTENSLKRSCRTPAENCEELLRFLRIDQELTLDIYYMMLVNPLVEESNYSAKYVSSTISGFNDLLYLPIGKPMLACADNITRSVVNGRIYLHLSREYTVDIGILEILLHHDAIGDYFIPETYRKEVEFQKNLQGPGIKASLCYRAFTAHARRIDYAAGTEEDGVISAELDAALNCLLDNVSLNVKFSRHNDLSISKDPCLIGRIKANLLRTVDYGSLTYYRIAVGDSHVQIKYKISLIDGRAKLITFFREESGEDRISHSYVIFNRKCVIDQEGAASNGRVDEKKAIMEYLGDESTVL